MRCMAGRFKPCIESSSDKATAFRTMVRIMSLAEFIQ